MDKFKPKFEGLDKRITALFVAKQFKESEKVADEIRQFVVHSLDSLRQEELFHFKQHSLARLAVVLEIHKAIHQVAIKYCQ